MKYFLITIIFAALALGAFLFFHNDEENMEKATEASSQDFKNVPEEVAVSEVLPVAARTVYPESIEAMARKKFAGRDFTIGRILTQNDVYTRYFITYKSEDDLTISGIMNVPGDRTGTEALPVLFLNHGYIDPAVYTNGRGLKREQDYFARRGYVVVHVDYRGHASSSQRPAHHGVLRGPMEYTEDVINAVIALRKANLNFVANEKFGMLGHSMGGGITQNVMTIVPDLMDAYVLYAPVSSTQWETVDRYMIGERDRGVEEFLATRGGTRDENPDYWRAISPVHYFDRVSGPVMLHHGTVDKDVPLVWSHDTRDALQAAGKEIIYHEYPGEPHEFATAWPTFMQRSVDFFDEYVE